MSERTRVINARGGLYESMTRVRVGSYTVRVWVSETHIFSGPSALVVARLKTIRPKAPMLLHLIARELENLPFVAAFEILDKNGNGIVVYTEWP